MIKNQKRLLILKATFFGKGKKDEKINLCYVNY